MRTPTTTLLLLLTLTLLAACSGAPRRPTTASAPVTHASLPTQPALPAGIVPSSPGMADEVVLNALALLGVPYRPGGPHPQAGLDCMGLVRWVFPVPFTLLPLPTQR